MAYAAANLKLLVPGMGGGPALWYYGSTDAHGTVEGASYFSDAVQRGLKVGDVVIVADTDGGYPTTIHSVASASGDAVTLNAATLA